MDENSGVAKILNDMVVSILDKVADGDGPLLIGYIVLTVLGALWLYCGIKIYFDARQRFATNAMMKYLFLVFGIITGPLGLIIYNFTKPKYTPEELDFIRIEHKFYYHQASHVLDCLNCDAYVIEGHAFCTNCGTQNRFPCEQCSQLTDYDDKHCSSCGSQLPYRMTDFEKKVEEREKSETVAAQSAMKTLVTNVRGKTVEVSKKVVTQTKTLVGKLKEKKSKKLSQPDTAEVSPETETAVDTLIEPLEESEVKKEDEKTK